jgi:hypothetical protein
MTGLVAAVFVTGMLVLWMTVGVAAKTAGDLREVRQRSPSGTVGTTSGPTARLWHARHPDHRYGPSTFVSNRGVRPFATGRQAADSVAAARIHEVNAAAMTA